MLLTAHVDKISVLPTAVVPEDLHGKEKLIVINCHFQVKLGSLLL